MYGWCLFHILLLFCWFFFCFVWMGKCWIIIIFEMNNKCSSQYNDDDYYYFFWIWMILSKLWFIWMSIEYVCVVTLMIIYQLMAFTDSKFIGMATEIHIIETRITRRRVVQWRKAWILFHIYKNSPLWKRYIHLQHIRNAQPKTYNQRKHVVCTCFYSMCLCIYINVYMSQIEKKSKWLTSVDGCACIRMYMYTRIQ